ncbi:MAG: NAD(P)-dependent oxidoreductase [Myxococcales bacterium]|nr:NAD(P)-dependent oxidoreductase [Myxococcales bacterium]
MNVAFLGLGTMGEAMARNVARRGHSLTVWNRTLAKAEALARALSGVRVAPTPAEAARGAEVVITMLSDPAALSAVCDGQGGALAGMHSGALLCEMSTVDPKTIHVLAELAAARGVDLLDAPVSGSRRPAEDGTLLILAGGDAAAVERARPVLEAMGRVRHVGPSGAGSATKLVLNSLGAHMMAGYTAALVLAAKLGLDPARTVEVIQGGAFASPLYAAKTPKVLAGDFTPDFRLALMLKDQELVIATARALGLDLPTLEAVRALCERAVAAGYGELDLTALIRVLEDQAGITVRG